MRGLLTTGLLLLQVPALAYGSPYPPPEAKGEAAPVIDDSPLTTQNHQLTLQAETAATVEGDNDITPAEAEGDFQQELTDLQALRAQIAQLADKIHTRETWLANASGITPPPSPSSITDCDNPRCIIRAISRKVKYAITSNNNNHNTPASQPQPQPNPTIPLPPWRGGPHSQPQTPNPTTPSGDEPPNDPYTTTLPAWHHIARLSLAIPLAVAVFFALYSAAQHLGRCVDRRRSRNRRRCYPEQGGLLPGYRRCCPEQEGGLLPGYRDEEAVREWAGMVDGGVSVLRGRGEGDGRWGDWCSATGDGKGGYGDEKGGYGDEKGGYVDGEEGCWDEEGGSLDEEGCLEEKESEREEGSVGGEIESFMTAVDWVESLIAEDEVGQGRDR